MKKFTSILLTALMLAAMLSVFAVPASAAAGHNHCTCGGKMTMYGDHTRCRSMPGWNAINNATAYNPNGTYTETRYWLRNRSSANPTEVELTNQYVCYYYLEEDVTLGSNDERKVIKLMGETNREDYAICLNGHTLDLGKLSITACNCNLNICDCKGGGKIIADGTVIYSSSPDANSEKTYAISVFGVTVEGNRAGGESPAIQMNGGTLKLYKATVRSCLSGTNDSCSVNGGAVALLTAKDNYITTTEMKMYGGSLEGCSTSGNGGALYAYSGREGYTISVYIEGATIIGGKAANGGAVYLKTNGENGDMNCEFQRSVIKDGTASGCGGNVYAEGNMNCEGCTFEGGTVVTKSETGGFGGNICLKGTATFKYCVLLDSAVKSETGGFGGNMAVMGGSASLISTRLENGSVTGTDSCGGNIYVAAGAALDMNACALALGKAEGDGGNLGNDGTVTVLPDDKDMKIISGFARGSAFGATANCYNGPAASAPDLSPYYKMGCSTDMHIWSDDGKCVFCEYECPHEEWDDNECVECGVKACRVGKVPHTWDDGKCTVCGIYECEANGNHTYSSGVCSVCGTKGCEIGQLKHNWVNGVCSVCNVKGCEIDQFKHNWVNGVCSVCNTPCDHEWDAATCKCTVCEYECRHNDGYTAGKCNICQQECKHGNTVTKTFCSDCGEEVKNTTPAVGSALSEGNMAIIIGIVALVIGLGGGFFIGRKKKPAPAESVKTDEK